MIKRYLNKVKDKVSDIIAYPIVSRKRKEARGYSNMATLIKMNRETGGKILGKDSSDPQFRMSVKARHAADDFRSKDRAKNARRYYQTLD